MKPQQARTAYQLKTDNGGVKPLTFWQCTLCLGLFLTEPKDSHYFAVGFTCPGLVLKHQAACETGPVGEDVTGEAGTSRNTSAFPHQCPTCGSPAYIGINTVKCSSITCRNHKEE